MKILIKIISLAIITISFQTVQAQENSDIETNVQRDNSIDAQFEEVFRKSGNFKGTNGQKYEAVKFSSLLKLKNNVLDSLKTLSKNLNDSRVLIQKQAVEIKNLKSNLNTTQTTLEATNKEKDNMSLFGMQMSKTGYNVLLWSIIGGLFLLLLVFIFRFKSSNTATKEAKLKLEEVEVEFEDHRRIALEREQKVRRQLQDEINKNKA